jgi:hypothetical protein
MGLRSGLLAGQLIINTLFIVLRKLSVPILMACVENSHICNIWNSGKICLTRILSQYRCVFKVSIPINYDEISANAICNARQIPNPKTISFKYATVRENAIPLLSKPAMMWTCPIKIFYVATSLQNITNVCPTSMKHMRAEVIVHSSGKYGWYLYHGW